MGRFSEIYLGEKGCGDVVWIQLLQVAGLAEHRTFWFHKRRETLAKLMAYCMEVVCI
jgi:hypothetical protein